jgi:hypothetical protein
VLIFYRISNNSRCKPKVPGASKIFCLQNTLNAFPDAEWTIIADNCDEETIEFCKKTKPTIITNFGNCGAFQFSLNKALDQHASDVIYFAEDDYLYCGENLQKIIEQGLQKADYVTLYNHPDKFEEQYDFGEVTKTIRIKQTYWKQTISTTMTFAARTETLREDRDVWIKYTQDKIPHDHEAFCSLNKTLICPIPGLACHMDLSDSVEEYIPNWVQQTLMETFREKLGGQFPEFTYPETPLRQLKIMQAILDFNCQ